MRGGCETASELSAVTGASKLSGEGASGGGRSNVIAVQRSFGSRRAVIVINGIDEGLFG
jgi:hypothetical protein